MVSREKVEEIQRQLSTLEGKDDVRVLHAVESGSRGVHGRLAAQSHSSPSDILVPWACAASDSSPRAATARA
jgi:hypothetical protein